MKRVTLLGLVALGALVTVLGLNTARADVFLGGACAPACEKPACEPACEPCCRPGLLARIRARCEAKRVCCEPCAPACEKPACEKPACAPCG